MAKNKAEATATEAKAEEAVTLTEAVTGTLSLASVEVDETGEPVETKALTITKGKNAKGNTAYMASANGVSGKVAASIKAAINDLLVSGLKVLPSVWAVPSNEKDVHFPDMGNNKPKEPETLDDLSPEMAAGMQANMASLTASLADYAEASARTVASVRHVAEIVRDVRLAYTKAEWTIFAKLAPANSEVAKLLTAKNTLGEFVFFANIPADLLDVMPAAKKSPKAAQAWVNGLRATVAHTLVDHVKANADAFVGMTASEAVRAVIGSHFDGEERFTFDEQEASDLLLDLHVGGWPGVDVFDVATDGTLVPARDEGKHVTASLFGSEGADELVKALCGAFNSWKSPEVKAEASAAKERAKGVMTADFTRLSPDAAALHVFNILAARVNAESEETLKASTDDCLVIVDKLGGWFEAVVAGTMTVADVLAIGKGADVPASEDDAEADADAA